MLAARSQKLRIIRAFSASEPPHFSAKKCALAAVAGNPSLGLRQHRIYPNGCLRGHRIWRQHKRARLRCGSCSLGCCHCVAICTDSRQVWPPQNDCCLGLVGANSYVAGCAVTVVFFFGGHTNYWQAAWHCSQRVCHCFRHVGNGQQHSCVGT